MPEISLGKLMKKLIFWKLPVHPGGEIYTVFDEESDFQDKKNQNLEPGAQPKKRTSIHFIFIYSTLVL